MENSCIHLPKLSLKNFFIVILLIMFLFLIGHDVYEDSKTLKILKHDVIELKENVNKYHQNQLDFEEKQINFQRFDSIFNNYSHDFMSKINISNNLEL